MALRILINSILRRMEHALETAGRNAGARDDAARGEFISPLISERGAARADAEAGARRRGPRLG